MTPLETLQELRREYPTPMSPAQIGALLNAVAWVHRAEGYGLLKKPSGSNCPQPQTGAKVSKDILCVVDGSDLRLFDVLIDAEGKGSPTWGTKKPLQNLSLWTAPVDAAVPLPPTKPEPPPPPVPTAPAYNEAYAVEFGRACNKVFQDSGAAFDPGMIAVHATRAAFDYYVGEMTWPASFAKHIKEFRKEYGL